MHRAGRGFETVFAEYRIWTDHARGAEAHRAATAAMHPATGQGRQGTATATAGGGARSSAPSGESERIIRLWMADDDRAREEQESQHFSSYAVVSGGQW